MADPRTNYKVVINHEEQYRIWTVDQRPTREWRDAGFNGNADACIQYIIRRQPDITRDELAALRRSIGL